MVFQAPSFFELELLSELNRKATLLNLLRAKRKKTVGLHQAFPPSSGKILIRQFMGQQVRDQQQEIPKIDSKLNTPILYRLGSI
jgi:hypothetical protein